MLDLEFVRSQFPALESAWTLFDNAGGTVPARQVIERVTAHMARLPVQLGASYELSVAAVAAVSEGRRAAATLIGAEPDETVFGASSTMLAALLARSLRPLWKEGDEVIVTDLDHEANVGPWRALERTGIVVREWCFQADSMALELADLEPLLTERTRLVAFTHCSNVVGTVHDARAMTDRIRATGALSCVDGVAFAPHRRVDVRAFGADFYLVSLYKVFGPHIGLLYARREQLGALESTNHFFVGEENPPLKLEPGNACYELAASIPGIVEYFTELDRHHGGAATDAASRLDRAFERIAAHETELVAPLLAFLDAHPRVRILGSPDAGVERRVPTVCFTVDGLDASEVPTRLDERRIATRYGHFYAYRPIERLGLLERNGAVRVSLAHYNTSGEVERLVGALEELLSA